MVLPEWHGSRAGRKRMNALLTFFHPKPKSWIGCRPLSAAERVERYSLRHAEDMRQRENEGAGFPRVQLRGDRMVLVALRGSVNVIPLPTKDKTP